jgi:argininosuccinate lyase
VGAVVRLAEMRGIPLQRLSRDEVAAVHRGFGRDWARVFDLRRAMSRRAGTGMPGPVQVKRQLAEWKKRLA